MEKENRGEKKLLSLSPQVKRGLGREAISE
jgi:hypothetical protein